MMNIKFIAACLMILATSAALTACNGECTHENVGYSNAVGATCTSVGYSGDKQCNDCGEIVELGKELPMTEHIATIENNTEPTCKTLGYSGDTICEICRTVLEEGHEIELIEHNTTIEKAKEASCTEPGYTGDIICTTCGTIVEEGTVIDSLPHDTYLKDGTQATCTTAGYSGDTYCRSCNELISKGSEISPTGHFPVNQNYKSATCSEDGYTGDSVCNSCNTLLSRGEVVSATGHSPANTGEIPATYTSEGYTGDTICIHCREILKKGESTPMLVNAGSISGNSSIEQQILSDMNAARAQQGAGALSLDAALNPATNIRANEYRYWANEGNHQGDPHHRANGECYYTIFAQTGITSGNGIAAYPSHGEILAASSDHTNLFSAWMNSSGHRDSILNPAYTCVSISVIFYDNMYYACAIFHD